jgi:hypothetical protein
MRCDSLCNQSLLFSCLFIFSLSRSHSWHGRVVVSVFALASARLLLFPSAFRAPSTWKTQSPFDTIWIQIAGPSQQKPHRDYPCSHSSHSGPFFFFQIPIFLSLSLTCTAKFFCPGRTLQGFPGEKRRKEGLARIGAAARLAGLYATTMSDALRADYGCYGKKAE